MITLKDKLFIIITILVSIVLLIHRQSLPPDQFYVLVLILTLFLGRAKKFVRDWTLPIVLILLYDYLRGALTHLVAIPHVFPQIKFGLWVHGFTMPVELQHAFYTPGHLHWYDYAATFFYMTHFIVPLTVALFFWLTDIKVFKQYLGALILLSYAALVTFIFFPAAPPWVAAQLGYLPHLYDIYGATTATFPPAFPLPTVYAILPPDFVAAVPSLHAAYPWLTFLFLSAKFRKLTLPLLAYVFCVWISTLYLAQHYTFDLVTGMLYSTAAFLIVTQIWNPLELKLPRRARESAVSSANVVNN